MYLTMHMTEHQRPIVFIIKFGAIGDVIMAIPAARALYESGYSIYWAAGKIVQPLLESYSWIRVFVVDDAAMQRGGTFACIKSILDFWRRLGFRQYDQCATLYYDKRYSILTWPILARRKFSLSLQGRQRLLLPGRHHADEYARLLLELEDSFREKSSLPVKPDRLPSVVMLERRNAPRVAIFPGGTNNLLRQQTQRRWPIEKYVAFTEQLLARGWEVFLLGDQRDNWVKPHFQHLSVVERLGVFSLPEVVSVCDQCDAVVTHDTGPLHLAGLSDACIVGIFGPTDPSTRVPRRHSVTGIWGGQGFACRPCYDGRDFAPCQFNGCMHQVTPELVLRELDRLLLERAEGTPQPWRVVSPTGT